MQQVLRTGLLWGNREMTHDKVGLTNYEKSSPVITSNHVSLNPSTVVRVLGGVALLLVLASLTMRLMVYLTGRENIYGLVRLFDLDSEQNIPTFFSSFLLLFAAVLLAVIATLNKKQASSFATYWTVLSLGFFYMAVDEASSIHELLIRPMRELLGGGRLGVFYFAWVIPGLAVVLIFTLFFLRFTWRLPGKTRLAFVVAAVLYVGGALGVEMIGGRYAEAHVGRDWTYSMITTVEESLEMAGSIVFLRALLAYILDNYGEVRLRFEDHRGRLQVGDSLRDMESGAGPRPSQSDVSLDVQTPTATQFRGRMEEAVRGGRPLDDAGTHV